MLKAVKAAEKFGDQNVSEAINEEAIESFKALEVKKRHCNARFEDEALSLCSQLSSLEQLLEKYEVAEECVRRDYGLSCEEFQECLPKARRVFEKKARTAWNSREIEQRLRAKMMH